MTARRLRYVQVVVLASDDEITAIADRMGDAICVPADHQDDCVTPWTMSTCLVDDLDEPRRSDLRALAED